MQGNSSNSVGPIKWQNRSEKTESELTNRSWRMIPPRSRELMDKAMEKPVIVLGSEIVAFPQLDSLQKRRSIPNALSALEKQFAGSDAHHNSDMRMLLSFSMWPARLRCDEGVFVTQRSRLAAEAL